MSLHSFLSDPEWDAPFFKILASNDTGAATGNQAGVVIPVPLRQYFPELNPLVASPLSPTVDHRLSAELWLGTKYLATVDSRYQFQTWGGTRSPESRLTDNLGPLRNAARGEDLLIMRRHAIELTRFQLILVKQENIGNLLEGITSRWGILGDAPVTDQTLDEARHELAVSEAAGFSLFDPSATLVETRSKRLSRTIVFRNQLFGLYEGKCAMCGNALATPLGRSELEAAHVVPRNLGGTNDARNGLGLCRQHHWAFDRGLLGIDSDRRVFVPSQALRIVANEPLRPLHGTPLLEANLSGLRVHESALRWHFEHTMLSD